MRTRPEDISPEQQELARRLRAAREGQGLSQEYVADQIGIPRSALSEIEHGRRRVDCLELTKLARVYVCRAADFLAEDGAVGSTVTARISIIFQSLSNENQRTIVAFAQFLRYRATRCSEANLNPRHQNSGLGSFP